MQTTSRRNILKSLMAGGVIAGTTPTAAREQHPQDHIPGALAHATVVFGHWAALGLRFGDDWIALDSGCAWGGPLTAVRLEDRRVFQVARLD